MVFRGVIAASCVVVALAAPARAQEGCTTQLREDLVDALAVHEEEDPPYPIVERHPSGSVTVHPQNVIPSVEYSLGLTLQEVDEVAAAVTTWVDCID